MKQPGLQQNVMNGGKPTVFELLVYEQTEQRPVSLVKHFADQFIISLGKPQDSKWVYTSLLILNG